MADSSEPTPKKTPRRPYEKPQVEWEEAHEERPGLVSACNKVTIAQSGCDAGTTS